MTKSLPKPAGSRTPNRAAASADPATFESTVQPGRRHPHTHFAGPGAGLRNLTHLKDFRSPELLL
jgi:hypothetical protein